MRDGVPVGILSHDSRQALADTRKEKTTAQDLHWCPAAVCDRLATLPQLL
jgi:hypothetical protein